MATTSPLLSARFKAAFRASPYKSLRRLSDECQCSHSQAQKIWSGAFDHSDHGPGAVSMRRLCTALGVSLDHMFPDTGRRDHRPDFPEFFSRYRGKETPIARFADIIPFCDVYRKPTRGKTRLRSVGPRSLLAEKARTTDAELLQGRYETWPKCRQLRIFEWQRRAWDVGALGEPDGNFTADYPSSPREMHIPLFRAACRVVDDTEPLLLIYCDTLPLRQGFGDMGHE